MAGLEKHFVDPNFELRQLSWPIPGNTRHREYTVTDKCYLIEAQNACSGCTMVNVQEAEKGVVVDFSLPRADEARMRVNVDFVTGIAQREVDGGTNVLTLMGGDPLTIKDFDRVISWVTKHPVLNAKIYSSSAYYHKPDGSLNAKFFDHERAGLFSPEFGYFTVSVDSLVTDPKDLPPSGHPRRGELFKSYHGLLLAEQLVARGHEVNIHQTLKEHTLEDTLKLYEWAKARGIKFSICPMVWVPYVSNGKSEAPFQSHLRPEHEEKLQKIVDYLLKDTIDRYKRRDKRIVVNSSAFLRLLPKYGPMNSISCRIHREGKRPNGQDIHPNGTERWCIAQNTEADGHRCGGCFYIGIDRDGDYWNFEHLAGLKEGDIRFTNSDVWIKDPKYDPTGNNLFFTKGGENI
jgi:MoaA/NifB/PqqE/SkfB family radical SAM enzyme